MRWSWVSTCVSIVSNASEYLRMNVVQIFQHWKRLRIPWADLSSVKFKPDKMRLVRKQLHLKRVSQSHLPTVIRCPCCRRIRLHSDQTINPINHHSSRIARLSSNRQWHQFIIHRIARTSSHNRIAEMCSQFTMDRVQTAQSHCSRFQFSRHSHISRYRLVRSHTDRSHTDRSPLDRSHIISNKIRPGFSRRQRFNRPQCFNHLQYRCVRTSGFDHFRSEWMYICFLFRLLASDASVETSTNFTALSAVISATIHLSSATTATISSSISASYVPASIAIALFVSSAPRLPTDGCSSIIRAAMPVRSSQTRKSFLIDELVWNSVEQILLFLVFWVCVCSQESSAASQPTSMSFRSCAASWIWRRNVSSAAVRLSTSNTSSHRPIVSSISRWAIWAVSSVHKTMWRNRRRHTRRFIGLPASYPIPVSIQLLWWTISQLCASMVRCNLILAYRLFVYPSGLFLASDAKSVANLINLLCLFFVWLSATAWIKTHLCIRKPKPSAGARLRTVDRCRRICRKLN